MKTRKTIMVVDDDAGLRQSIADLLELNGYPVVLAENGSAALEQLRDTTPSLILLDLKMPVMNGWCFLRRVRDQPGLGEIPILVMSGEQAGQINDAVAVLTKPVAPQLLLSAIGQFSR